MNFTKLQGAGNDFILIEARGIDRDWSRLAIAMCDRHFGVGADGLLLLLPSDNADVGMRILNSDGSEAEACGNGMRCLVKYVLDNKMISRKLDMAGEISLETIAGIRKARLRKATGNSIKIQISMGVPKFEAEDIPVVLGQGATNIKAMLSCPLTVKGKELLLNFVSMGNPHAVHFLPHPVSDFPLSQIGPEVEQDKMFPNRINFGVARVINRQQLEARVWERGVGETLACGSGTCAIAVVAQLLGYISSQVDIKLPGGTLEVGWDGKGEVFLSGPADIVFVGEWPGK